MIVCYHRSSSLGTLEFCQQKYFLQYNLSFKDKTNAKALMGTITHKVMQTLGDKKVAMNKGLNIVEDEETGRVIVQVRIDLPSKFESFLRHEDERASKFSPTK